MQLVRVAEFEMALTTLVAFLQTDRHAVVTRLAPDDMTHVCGNDGVLIPVFQGMVCSWLDMCIFRVLLSMHCNPILAFLTTAPIAEADRDVTGVEGFPIEFKQSMFIFIPLVAGVTRKRADGAEVTE